MESYKKGFALTEFYRSVLTGLSGSTRKERQQKLELVRLAMTKKKKAIVHPAPPTQQVDELEECTIFNY